MKKITPKQVSEIKSKFKAIASKDDLLVLINDAKNIIYGEDSYPVNIKTINYFANPKNSLVRYNSFEISKKSGGKRIINAPVKGLKHILKPLNLILQCVHEPHYRATGFVLGKSIADNANLHVGKHYVYNIDLKDFFHLFDRNQVKLGFMKAPFNFKGELEPVAFLLASLCTHPFKINDEVKIVLPQGAPTSPTITNILCTTLDRRLNGLAKRFKITYSRYADDITFSSQTNVFEKEDFQKELIRIIEDDQKLTLNNKKTRLQQSGYRQEVTGLVVNNKVNVNTKYVKQLRMWLYYWEKYGYSKAEAIFKKDYVGDKGHVKKGEPNFINVISGKLEYLKMVKGPVDSTYSKLNSRWNKLLQQSTLVEKVLKEWEHNGIQNAIELYKEQMTNE
jgi:hypothetical protein